MKRYWEIDALRGLMLLLMTVTHLPTRLTDPMGQPFGWVSAAEGFVLLSAFVSGLVYSRIGQNQGVEPMRRAFFQRALKVYMAQAATLLFLFTIIAALGLRIDQSAVKDMLSYYLAYPREGFLFSLLLVYEPALLDILPMYIFFMLLSPWVLAFAMRHGWAAVMLTSVGLWALAQFGLSEWVFQLAVRYLHITVPFHEMGAFNAFAWQFLWFIGLWMGASRNMPDAKPFKFSKPVILAAVVLAFYGLYWRHEGLNGQAPFGSDEHLNMLFDKWRLGPLRLLNLTVLGICAVEFGPELMRRIPRLHWLEAMGSASLPVFCAHLVAVLTVLATYGGSQTARPWWGDAILLIAVFAWLLFVAYGTLWIEAKQRGRAEARMAKASAGTQERA